MRHQNLPLTRLLLLLSLAAASPALAALPAPPALPTPPDRAAAAPSDRAAAAPRGQLFHLVGAAPKAAAESQSSEVIAERDIAVDFTAIAAAESAELLIPLLDGNLYSTARTDFERRGPNDFTWRGKVLGDDGSVGSATLTFVGRRMAGLITMPAAVYQVMPVPGGGHRLQQIDQSRFDPCGGAQAPDLGGIQPKAFVPPKQKDGGPLTRVSVMVLYTPSALAKAGGIPEIRLLIQSAIDLTNSGFINSQIGARVYPVDVEQLDYSETGNSQTDLEWLASNPAVDRLRNGVGADLVSLIVEKMDKYCGIGYVMRRDALSPDFAPFAYSVVRRLCAVGILAFAHELGHNFGCEHDPANGAPPSEASFPFSFGHYSDQNFRTIMSYSNQCTSSSCPVIDYYSNPDISYLNIPTGIPDQRDNHQTINITKELVASFMRPQDCQNGPNNLCLLGDRFSHRFKVEVVWRNQYNQSNGYGVAIPVSDEAGFFSFGDLGNVELLVKILDFGSVIKLFYGELTNLQFTIIVTDLQTGAAKRYSNTAGDCGAIDQAAFPKSAASSAKATGVAAAPPADFSGVLSERLHVLDFPQQAGADGSPSSESLGRAGSLPLPKDGGGACRPGPNVLCLLGGRFQLTVSWSNPGNNTSGQGGAVPLGSDITGAFYFTDRGNLELLAKIIDFGNRIAVFYGTLSDLAYTITVTDTQTGKVKTYTNAAGHFCGGLDNTAF